MQISGNADDINETNVIDKLEIANGNLTTDCTTMASVFSILSM